MNVIKAKKIPKKDIVPSDIISELCYYYPQYKYHEARKLPYKRVIQLLKVALKERGKHYFELTQIVAAPHTKKGSGVKKLQDRYKSWLD